MPQSYDVLFASSNADKFGEAEEILRGFGISAGFFRCELAEIQSDSLGEIARHKVRDAFSRCGRPVMVEDDGMFVDSLGGFPGPYSSFVFRSIGNAGILRLLKTGRAASFHSVIAYRDSGNEKLFRGKTAGKISARARGRGWGYDPIFVPSGQTETFAQADKNTISHRYKALKKFAAWF